MSPPDRTKCFHLATVTSILWQLASIFASADHKLCAGIQGMIGITPFTLSTNMLTTARPRDSMTKQHNTTRQKSKTAFSQRKVSCPQDTWIADLRRGGSSDSSYSRSSWYMCASPWCTRLQCHAHTVKECIGPSLSADFIHPGRKRDTHTRNPAAYKTE